MSEKRVLFSNIVKNQLPQYVREEFPLVEEFLSQYYRSQEFQGAPVDLIQNIDSYIKLDSITNQVSSAILLEDANYPDDEIFIDVADNQSIMSGFPDSYGLIKINDEIITYTGKTSNSFTGCVRGFSGISNYVSENDPEQLVFSTSTADYHEKGSTVVNLSSLFLTEFLKKTKYQFLPGFENRSLSDNLNQNIFIKQVKDFYKSKGTDESFHILFLALYGETAKIIHPKEYLFRPSDADYRITKDLVVEPLEGDPLQLINSTIFQDKYGDIPKASCPVTQVEKIVSETGREYYRLSIDSGYNRDINVRGALSGDFKVHPKTKLIGDVSASSTTLDVDSTVGFPNSGTLYVTYQDQTTGSVSYTSKSLTQFFGCSSILHTITDGTEIGLDTFAYGKSFNQEDTITFRIRSVLQELDIVDDTKNYEKGDDILIKTLGIDSDDSFDKKWIYNTCPRYRVESITLVNSSNWTYRVKTKEKNILKNNDSILVILRNGTKVQSTIGSVSNENEFTIKNQGSIDTTLVLYIQRNLLKFTSSKYSDVGNVSTNIQNLYKNKKKNKILVASSSLPYYANLSIDPHNYSVTFGGSFVGDTFAITSGVDHGFYTGDSVYYTPEKLTTVSTDDEGNKKTEVTIASFICDEGIYFIKRVDSNNIKLAKSRSDLNNNIFITLLSSTDVVNNTIKFYKFYNKSLKNQKLLREIAEPINDGGLYPTSDYSKTGILINGVEILNYKSSDRVYYGRLESINVSSGGSGYDVINPPLVSVADSIGVGATGHCSVSGSLSEIRIIDPGFNYVEEPVIKITGGNGFGAIAKANMKLINHEVSFSSSPAAQLVNLTSDTIGFSTYHKFRNAEKVIYVTNGQRGIVGLVTNSDYYVSTKTTNSISLHRTESDAISGINTIGLTGYGEGNHIFQTVNKKLVIGNIQVQSTGTGYENKKRVVRTSTGISTSSDYIEIENHGYQSGEKIVYSTTGTVIGGLSTTSYYFVSKIDNNKFRLSNVGTGSTVEDFYYQTNQYVDLTSVGVGTHSFNYPEINVQVVGRIGISSIGSQTFEAQVQPIFRGTISSIQLTDNGSSYGCDNIINYLRNPEVTLLSGNDCQLTPIIAGGRIKEVVVNNPGSRYNSPPNIEIIGIGTGAILTPIIDNGEVVEIKVIESGFGYTQETTSILVSSSGKQALFSPKIQNWRVNNFVRYFNRFTPDDGILAAALNEDFELQYTHLYAPRKLRENLFAVNQIGETLYGITDLKKINNVEVNSTDHSPIIGWAYDGNPIYGPYGYITNQGGVVSQMKSGYVLELDSNRPPTSYFPEGFFIEDFTYKKVSDPTVLDENNGRFCITPEYPNGTYAYFATLQTFVDSFGPFIGYKRPEFPYLIGNSFECIPNSFNFQKYSNQDNLNLNETDWIRNTNPYNLEQYNYINLPNNLNQKSEVKFAYPGSVKELQVNYGGSGYKVNDIISFNETTLGGFSAKALVSKIKGVGVSSVSLATSSVLNVRIEPDQSLGFFNLVSSSPHQFSNSDIVTISGLNTTSTRLEGQYLVGVTTNTLSLKSGIGSVSTTGIVTYFSVAGNISQNRIRENDIYLIGSEQVKVLNIDTVSSRLRVLREVNNTVSAAHSATTVLYERSRKLSVNTGLKTTYSFKQNKEIYFNPIESVGIGTLSGIGIGATLNFSNPGVGDTQQFIPTRSILLPNHNLVTGDSLTYYTNNGSSLVVSNNGISTYTLSNASTVYVAKITDDLIGIATVRVGLGSTGNFVGIVSSTQSILYFVGVGTGEYHSFATNYNVLTGNVTKNIVTVSTSQTHGLLNNDVVNISVNPGTASTFTIKYNDYNRKLLVNPQAFTLSDVDTSSNTITILDHGFEKGQKVLHTSSTPGIGLTDNSIYYVLPVDNNSFKLTRTYYQSQQLNAEVVDIITAANGTISPINPPISVYKNSQITFDLSDSSLSYIKSSTPYPAFKLEFYKDTNFTQNFETSGSTNVFNIQRTGTVGITTGANLTLTVNSNLPEKLYYTLVPLFENDIPAEKSEINIDDLVENNNEIIVKESGYNGEHSVVATSSTSFTYLLKSTPESSSYVSGISSIVYTTSSENTQGAISDVKLTQKGKNYYTLPSISSIETDNGENATFDILSDDIGKIKTYTIKDVGFDLPSDYTLRPSAALPQVIKLTSLASFESIGISSFGRGYNVAPKLVVIDGQTNNVVSDVELQYSSDLKTIRIVKNTFALTDSIPTIIPTQNPNGVGISSIKYDENSGNVTVTLATEFNSVSSFPFAVGDKVLVENINLVSTASTIKGFNSENYNYQLFTINNVDPNIGGIGATVSYNLSNFLNTGESAGVFKATSSSGRIIPQKYFPIFDIVTKKGEFYEGETVVSNSATGIVESWDKNNSLLRIASKQDFVQGEVLKGLTSSAKANILEIESPKSYFNLNSYSTVNKGWQSDAGFLNDNLQKIQDSFYYQNFSYSIKSRVPYDEWNDAVSSLNHTSGFKKFSDLQVESKLSTNSNKTLKVSVGNEESSVTIINDLSGFASLNCFYDFDLVKENFLEVGGFIFSDEIVFSNKILTDYYESTGNRVLSIDDISSEFNSNPRPTAFSEVSRFALDSTRAQKFYTYVIDKTFRQQRQFLILTSVHDGNNFYINQYGRLENSYDLGSFDFGLDGTDGLLLFYPTRYSVNNYDVTVLCHNIKDGLTGFANTSFGGIVDFATESVNVSAGTTTTIVSVGNTYTSLKLLTQLTTTNNEYEFNELTVLSDGSSVDLIDYGQLQTSTSSYSSSGLGTYYPYIQGGNIKIDFIPNPGVAATVTTSRVAIANTTFSGIGTVSMRHAEIEARTTSIAATTTPTANVIAQYSDDYDSSYFIVQVSDITSSRYQVGEILVLDDDTETYTVEFATIDTGGSIGTFGSQRSGTITQLLFTPPANREVQVKTYMNALRFEDSTFNTTFIGFDDASLFTDYAPYFGTEIDVKRQFELTHKTYPIFQRPFDGSDADVVDVTENTIKLPNHFFVTGEKVKFGGIGAGSTQSIGIASTYFGVGIGTTSKLPSEAYVVKISEDRIRLARNAQDALLSVPNVLNFTSVGIGSTHIITAVNQNAKVLVTIDNVIQSPIVASAVTSTLSQNVTITDNELFFTGISSFFGGDLIKISDEIMRIESIGVGATNSIRVVRPWLGTGISTHSSGDLVTKITGEYNIVDNSINFITAPYGNVPIGSTTNPPSERDWTGITTGSSFHGRTFLRSGITNTSDEAYYKNYVFDNISNQFNGIDDSFALTSNGTNVTGISTENAIIVINDIFQGPGASFDYYLTENAGITSAIFTGSGTGIGEDANATSLPLGGIIVSVGSTSGFGYQPLVSAGGTAIVSVAGTISTVSVGNTGSGYRAPSSYQVLANISSTISAGSTTIFVENEDSVLNVLGLLNTGSNCTIGIGTYITQTSIISAASTSLNIGIGSTVPYQIPSGSKALIQINNPTMGIVKVGIASTSSTIPSITHIGFATVIGGHISTSVSVTKVSTGHTSSNPPYLVFDAPTSYSNIPLIYSSQYTAGVGTEATVDIIVGQGSSVIDFTFKSFGYAYGQNDVLTIPIGGATGIPTTSSVNFSEFQINVIKTISDKFSGWSIGELEVLDTLDSLFDGEKVVFPLSKANNPVSIRSTRGSNITVQDTLLVFINDVLQVPGQAYIFNGGSVIRFTEAPKSGDRSRIVFYKGSGDIDVAFRDIIETIKIGDELTIGYDSSIGQSSTLQESVRVVDRIDAIDVVSTNPYFGPGNVNDSTLLRPVTFCKQTVDKIIDEQEVGKDRILYEPQIHPSAYLIKSVGVGDTVLYVDNTRPFFNPQNESQTSFSFQNSVNIISQDSRNAAIATCTVSVAGTVSSISILDSGSGYVSSPDVIFEAPVGLGTTQRATATATIISGSISTIDITSGGVGYASTNPPVILIAPPTFVEEINPVSSYGGDSGIIVGFGTTSASVVDKMIFDFYIPQDSFLRNSSIVGTATTLSGISTGDYFIVYNSNVGSAITSITSLDTGNSTIGIGTRFVDNIYQVDTTFITQSSVIGIGTTQVRRVYARISGIGTLDFSSTSIEFDSTLYTLDAISGGSGYLGIVTTSNYFGNYSWGKIQLSSRSELNEFNSYNQNGGSGINTSSYVIRTSPLRYAGYDV